MISYHHAPLVSHGYYYEDMGAPTGNADTDDLRYRGMPTFKRCVRKPEKLARTSDSPSQASHPESEEGEVRVFSSLARARLAKPHRTVHASMNPE